MTSLFPAPQEPSQDLKLSRVVLHQPTVWKIDTLTNLLEETIPWGKGTAREGSSFACCVYVPSNNTIKKSLRYSDRLMLFRIRNRKIMKLLINQGFGSQIHDTCVSTINTSRRTTEEGNELKAGRNHMVDTHTTTWYDMVRHGIVWYDMV